MYKACQKPWTMLASYYENTYPPMPMIQECPGEGTAYWLEDGKCLYTFVNSEFGGIEDESTPEQDALDVNIGFKMKFKSTEKCADDDSFKFSLKGVCLTDTKDAKYKTWARNVNITATQCKANAVYYGPEACKLYTVELQKDFEKF